MEANPKRQTTRPTCVEAILLARQPRLHHGSRVSNKQDRSEFRSANRVRLYIICGNSDPLVETNHFTGNDVDC